MRFATTAPLPDIETSTVWANMDDCSLVFTTSNGDVIMAPHMPPSLRARKHAEHVSGGCRKRRRAAKRRKAASKDQSPSHCTGRLHAPAGDKVMP